MSDIKEVKLHPYQSLVFKSKARFVGLIAGTGGGKTFTGPVWLYREIARKPGERWLVVAPTYKLLKREPMREFLRFFRGTDLEGDMNLTDLRYDLPCGGQVYFCSADKPKYLEGGQFSGAWLDEAGVMSRWVWVVIQARLGMKRGRALLTSTPYDKGWFYWDFFKRYIDGDDNYYCVQFDSTENPAYPEEEFERMREVLAPKEFERRYRGKFVELDDLVFPSLSNCATEKGVRPPKEGEKRVGGIDFGWSAPTAALSAYIEEGTGRIVVWREFYDTHILTSKLANHLDSTATYYADPSKPEAITELCGLGYDVRPGDNSFHAGILKVNEWTKSERVVLSREVCPNLLSEAAALTDSGEDKRPKGNDHALDAFRYLLMGLDLGTGLSIYLIGDDGKLKTHQ